MPAHGSEPTAHPTSDPRRRTECTFRWRGHPLVPSGRLRRARYVERVPAKHLTLPEREAYRRLEDVVGCKWSAAVVGALHRGVNRPGRLERYIPGISTKVLSERLRKLRDYGLVVREDHSADTSLHVEYRLTPAGERLAAILEQLHALQAEHDAARPDASAPVT